MAIEKYTVLYAVQDGGSQAPLNYKEKTIKVKKGEKNKGLVNSDTEPSRQFEVSALVTNSPFACRFVTLEAEGAEEAAEAVRAFYGQSLVNNVVLAGLTSGFSEVKMQN